MRPRQSHRLLLSWLLVAGLVALGQTAAAQNAQNLQSAAGSTGAVKTDTRMLYHNGPLVTGTVNIYVVWYGCWTDSCGIAGDTASEFILTDFLSRLGSTPYFQINSTYTNCCGQSPSGGLMYGGAALDRYSHGVELTALDVQGIVADQILQGEFALDPSGIYLVLASADVSSGATGFCIPSAPPHHGYGTVLGSRFLYGFVGNPVRCPSVAAPQFVTTNGSWLPTPNGNLGADAMASKIAHVLSTIVTDPYGSGWFDRYGLENADKCPGQFGATYVVANGARANMVLGERDFLIQENWVNDRRGRCAMSQ